MTSCVVCLSSSLATVYCTQDKAFLCHQCDVSIHNANALSRRHQRVPVCDLCHRHGATVYCHEDAAALCQVCDHEVHSQNPIPHCVVPIAVALAQGLAKVPELRESISGSARPGASAHPESAEVSICGDYSGPAGQQHAAAEATGVSALFQGPSEGNTSTALVPDVYAGAQPSAFPTALPTHDALDTKAPWAKEFDALDFEGAWFGNLEAGLDPFADLLGPDAACSSDDAPGMVPTFMAGSTHMAPPSLPPAPLPAASHSKLSASQQQQQQGASECEFLPPNLFDEDDLAGVMSLLPTDEEQSFMAPSARMHQAHMHSATPAVPVEDSVRSAAPKRGAGVSTEELHQESGRVAVSRPSKPAAAAGQASGAALLSLNGANLTREQRVARYLEKRKNRKFCKTIRYASRKAYAEVRPRIKGRFATKEEVAAWKAKKEAGVALAPEEELIF